MEEEQKRNLTFEELNSLIDERIQNKIDLGLKKEVHVDIGDFKLKAFLDDPKVLCDLAKSLLKDEDVQSLLEISKTKIKYPSYTDGGGE